MSLRQDDIQTLTNAIMAEAKQEANQILADAQAKAESIQQQGESEADAVQAERTQSAQEEAKAYFSHTIASAKLEAQTLKLQRREDLLAHVFDQAQEQLLSITQTPNYIHTVKYLVKEAVTLLSVQKEAIVRADQATQVLLSETVIADIESDLDIQLQMGEPLTQGTGVIVETLDGHRRYDNTLEMRLSRMQETLRTPVYRILIGEGS